MKTAYKHANSLLRSELNGVYCLRVKSTWRMGLPVLHLVLLLQEPFAVLVCQFWIWPTSIGVASFAELSLCLKWVVSEVSLDVRKLCSVNTLKRNRSWILNLSFVLCLVKRLSACYWSFGADNRRHSLSLLGRFLAFLGIRSFTLLSSELTASLLIPICLCVIFVVALRFLMLLERLVDFLIVF